MNSICKIYNSLPDFDKHIDLGCNVVLCYNSIGEWLKNTETGAIRQLTYGDYVYGFEDSDFNWDTISNLEHNRNAYSRVMRYGGICRWDDFIDGYCAFSWTLYPDGRYFADSDGYGADDDDEIVIYTILDADLNVVMPWQPMDVSEELKKLRTSK